ncbi:MAG TPA: HipA family kinase [Flavisolibacter sp.]|nr:HipA family kinase [Flavisolibacter sp.]
MPEQPTALRTVSIVRYIIPLREGGSLPALVDADDDFTYVLKFRGAGQGIKALIAELIGGEVARTLGFRVPELVFAQVDPAFGRTEPDEEIQDLLKSSAGLNLALHYLSGALSYDPAVTPIDPTEASRILWLDCLLTNVDRTAKNTNMLIWQKELWLIDHGASLYFHHAGIPWEEAALRPFNQVKDHVLLPWASELETVDAAMRSTLTPEQVHRIVSLIPQDWLNDTTSSGSPLSASVYEQFLNTRISNSSIFINEALHARATLI